MQTRFTRAVATATALAVVATSAQAQTGASCPAEPAALPAIPTPAAVVNYHETWLRRDACLKATDIFQFLAPQMGASIAGGNAILGASGPLGGFPHFTVGLRANAVQGAIPDFDGVTLRSDGPNRTNFATNDQWVGLPAVEVGVGLFKGIPLGITNVGGIDLLVSGFYVPKYEDEGFAIQPEGGSTKLGFGGRLGILQETAVIPGVSVSYLRRDLPTTSFTAAMGSDSIRISRLESKTSAWRLVAGKRFVFIAFAGGVGQDTYDSRAAASAYVAPRAGTSGGVAYVTPAFRGDIANTSQKLTRTNYFGDVSLNFPFLKIVGEVGRVDGGEVAPTYNSFGSRSADDAYTYASVGLRLAM